MTARVERSGSVNRRREGSGPEGFCSPPADIRSAAEAADSPSRSHTLTGAPLAWSSWKRTVIRSLLSALSSFLLYGDLFRLRGMNRERLPDL